MARPRPRSDGGGLDFLVLLHQGKRTNKQKQLFHHITRTEVKELVLSPENLPV
jgi:hypothetical protein